MSSTFFIYPLDDCAAQHLKQQEEKNSTFNMTPLTSNGLSRILEIPLSLLDNDTMTNNQFFNKNKTASIDQMFW